jgi:hypothetical protein
MLHDSHVRELKIERRVGVIRHWSLVIGCNLKEAENPLGGVDDRVLRKNRSVQNDFAWVQMIPDGCRMILHAFKMIPDRCGMVLRGCKMIWIH